MKKIFIIMIGFLFANSAMSANWEVIGNDRSGTYSIDTSRINKVQTTLSRNGEVRSSWIRVDYAYPHENMLGAKYMVYENYTKCKNYEVALNTLVSYNLNGKVIVASYNISGSSADYAKYKPVLPDSVGEDIAKKTCALTMS